MASLLSELQFCQMENDALRERLKTFKMDINSLRADVKYFLDNLMATNMIGSENLVLTPEDQERLLKIIERAIKTN